MGKIKTISEIINIREELRRNNKKVVHCHGVFDLIHPGHILHLMEAKKFGDVLIVSITSEAYVQKGPSRPYFNDEHRLLYLSAIEVVDYVVVDESVSALSIISSLKPDYYVKGAEYSDPSKDVTLNIDKEIECVRKYGGDIRYTSGDVFSSTKLINTAFKALPEKAVEESKKLQKKYDVYHIKGLVDEFESDKVLVIGDIIIDEYVFCTIQGIMSKDQGYSSRYIKTEQYLGGSIAVAKHIASFCKNVCLCASVDENDPSTKIICDVLKSNINARLLHSEGYVTATKKRYIQKRGIREEYQKFFSVNILNDETNQMNIDKSEYYQVLKDIISDYDLVVVCDFGHGQIDQTTMDIIQNSPAFVSLNCQTNSSNYGLNSIRKYNNVNSFTLDRIELEMAYNNRLTRKEELLFRLKEDLNAECGWLTVGSEGAVGIDKDGKIHHSPALVLDTKDTVGAGDAFHAIVGLCALHSLPIELSNLIGNAAGALMANVLGNSESLSKEKLLKYISTVLNV